MLIISVNEMREVRKKLERFTIELVQPRDAGDGVWTVGSWTLDSRKHAE